MFSEARRELRGTDKIIKEETAMTAKENYDARLQRVMDAIEMRTPDRVPMIPQVQTYPFAHAGHSMEQIYYDADLAAEDMKAYLREYEPDMASSFTTPQAGTAPIWEKLQTNMFQWPGMEGGHVDKNSVFQYVEKEYMQGDEYEMFFNDYTGWVFNKCLPRIYRSMECFANVDLGAVRGYSEPAMTMQFMDPRIVDAFQRLADAGRMSLEYFQKAGKYEAEVEEMGFPMMVGATTTVAFDSLSDTLRGTIGTMEDIMVQPENVKRAVEMLYPSSLYGAVGQMQNARGKFVFIPLHKGLEGFLSPEQYDEFYWPTFKRLVDDLVYKFGYTVMVYTEGKYDSRLERIADLPRGKVFYCFEDVDNAYAKKTLGKDFCLCGGFNSWILQTGTVEEVKDAVKRHLDIMAVDGGYIFDLADILDFGAKPENVAAMFETVKTYGKY